MALRDYQASVVARVKGAVSAGHRSVLVVMPTGAGKTVVASELISWLCKQGKTGVMVAPRSDLVRQASARLDADGIAHGLIAGWAAKTDPQLQPMHVGTAAAVSRRGAGQADFAIVDEAHLGHRRPDCGLVIGLTATPCLGTGERLPNWGTMVQGPAYSELVHAGVLCPPRIFAPEAPDHSAAKFTGRDLSPQTLEQQMANPAILTRCVDHWKAKAANQSTVVFCVSVQHANQVAASFMARGIPAATVTADTPADARAGMYGALATGHLSVLANCEVVGMGWDLPALQCVMLMRPTASLAMFIQMAGRGSRTAPGKTSYTLLDLAGNTLLHGSPALDRDWSDLPAPIGTRTTPDLTTKAPSFRCPACFYVHDKRPDACVACGAPMASARAIRYRNGALREIAADFAPGPERAVSERNKRRRQLIGIGRWKRGVDNPVDWAQGVLAEWERQPGLTDWDHWLRERGILKSRRPG